MAIRVTTSLGKIVQLAAQLRMALQHVLLGRFKHAIHAAQHGQGQDHVLVLAPFEGSEDQVGHGPDEADDLAVVGYGSGV
jgi:hypothetical protein